jgi:hypothetical protein
MMPRRLTETEREIPLFLIAHIVQKNVRIYGDEVQGISVRVTRRHFYNVSTRTRPIRRGRRGRPGGCKG